MVLTFRLSCWFPVKYGRRWGGKEPKREKKREMRVIAIATVAIKITPVVVCPFFTGMTYQGYLDAQLLGNLPFRFKPFKCIHALN